MCEKPRGKIIIKNDALRVAIFDLPAESAVLVRISKRRLPNRLSETFEMKKL